MKKTILKSLLNKVSVGEVIDIKFGGNLSYLSGSHSILEKKRGRGKCGSEVARVQNIETLHECTIGTPYNNQIVTIVYNGNKYGEDISSEVIPGTLRDVKMAKNLKDALTPLMGQVGRKVKIQSTHEPAFNGIFTVMNIFKSKGRYGQLFLNLYRENTFEKVEIWTYRHSGVIDSIEIIPVGEQQ